MSERIVTKLNADSIQTMGDVKTFLREHEARMEYELAEIEKITTRHGKSIRRNLKLITVSTWISGCVLGIVIGLSGIIKILEALF